MKLVFAWDSPAHSAATDVLTWMQSDPTARYWALVDVALLGTEKFKSTAHLQHWAPCNALANTSLEAFGDAAPQLIAISEEPQRRNTQVEQLLRLTAGTPALSWLHSAYPELALQMLFGYLGKAQIQDRPKPVHIRFADVRILPGLLRALNLNQRRRVMDIVPDWRWFDRAGIWDGWEINTAQIEVVAMDLETYLNLSQRQFSSLLKSAEADAFFHRLKLEHPNLMPALHRAAHHQNLTSILSTASELALKSTADRWLFALLSLSYGDGFHRCKALSTTWNVIRESGADLREQMRGWSPEIFKALNDYKAKQ